MNFSAYSIRNPMVATLLFALLMLGGLIGFKKMKIQAFPDMDFPVVLVSVPMIGASAEQLESDVARVVENKLASTEGLRRMTTIINAGVVTVALELQMEVALQEALENVRSSVDEVRGQLPADAKEPIVKKLSTTGLPIMVYTISAPDKDVVSLSWFVDDVISRRLANVNGVAQVSRIGGVDRQISVELSPVAMHALGISASMVSEQIRAAQLDIAAGEAKVGDSVQPIRVMGAVSSVEEIGELPIASLDGKVVRLKEVATIYDGFASPSSLALVDGKEVVAFDIKRGRGSSEVEVGQAVDATLAALQADYPELVLHKVIDRVEPVAENYASSLRMLIEGGVLAVVVVMLFLRNWRATFIGAVALPLSVVPAFLAMYWLGFSLNGISLLALSLVVGLLVDDAIVEVENIARHLQMGKTPYQAAMEAADEIGLAVIATTATLIAVFLPTAFMTGIVGQFFKQFGWTAAIAIFMSLLVARLVTPMMAAYLLRPLPHVEEKDGWLMRRYLALVSVAVRFRWLTLAFTVALFVASLGLVRFLSTSFIPANEISQVQINVELPPDARLADTHKTIEMARESIATMPEVKLVYSTVGQARAAFGPVSGANVNEGTLYVELAKRGERDAKADIEQRMRERLKQISGARVKIAAIDNGAGGYKLVLTGENNAVLTRTVRQLMRDIRGLAEVSGVSSNLPIAREEIKIYPDKRKLRELGVSTVALAQTLRVATVGDYDTRLSKLNLERRQLPIVITLAPEVRADIASIANLQIPSQQGLVRLGEIAEVVFDEAPSAINRYERMRTVTIDVEAKSGISSGRLNQLIYQLPLMQNLPEGVSSHLFGEAENMRELMTGFILSMAVGIFCIYSVLVLLFKRVLQPFTILMALPLSIGGAFVGLLLANADLSMPALIGLVMLMGVATKNSILLVDYVIIAEAYMSKEQALIDACRKRARPIIMTTIAMGAGMLPLIFGWGVSDPTFGRPMAVAVFGGLITSTLLSLVVIPTFYSVVESFSRLFKRNVTQQQGSTHAA